MWSEMLTLIPDPSLLVASSRHVVKSLKNRAVFVKSRPHSQSFINITFIEDPITCHYGVYAHARLLSSSRLQWSPKDTP